MVYEDPIRQQSRADSTERYYLGLKGEAEEQEDESKLIVKLKFPKSDGGETKKARVEEEEEEEEEQKKKNYFCYECKRGFSSGKALGGHKSSAHVQAGRDNYPTKKSVIIGRHEEYGCSNNNNSDEDEDGEVDGLKVKDNACGICEKIFPNRKALYGHMRLHPERSYRGMNPPSHYNNHQSSFYNYHEHDRDYEGENEDDDVKSAMEFDQSSDELDEEEEKEESEMTKTPSKPQIQDPHQTYLGSSRRIDEKKGNKNFLYTNSFHLDVDEDEDMEKDTTNPCEQENNNTEDDTYLNPKNNIIESGRIDEKKEGETKSNKKTKTRKKEYKFKVIGSLKKQKKKIYKCKDCHKVFESHQALGGHMSSHNKIIISSSNYENASRFIKLPNTRQAAVRGDRIGGCHSTQLLEQSWSSTTSPQQQKFLQFDLNELPYYYDDDHHDHDV